MRQFSLDGKVALVTGASRGIGRAIAMGLAEAGADVAVGSRTASAAEAAARAIAEATGRRTIGVTGDVSKSDDVRQLLAACVAELGRLDVLVNNAGTSNYFKRVEHMAEHEWREVIDTNLTGTFLCCQAASEHLQQGGRVINMVSIGASVGLPRLAAYCASKAGVEALTKVLALEWAERGVLVNAIGPAFLATDMTAGMTGNPRLREGLEARTPLGRVGTPDDVVGAAIFLASAASGYVTGQTLYVDGGWLAQ